MAAAGPGSFGEEAGPLGKATEAGTGEPEGHLPTQRSVNASVCHPLPSAGGSVGEGLLLAQSYALQNQQVFPRASSHLSSKALPLF